MDPVTIATTVVAFLSPYFVEGGKAAAKKVGKKLVTAIERRFKGKPSAEEALTDVKDNPQDEDFQAALRVQLKKAMKDDDKFAAELAELLEEAKTEAPATYNAAVYGSGAIAQGEGTAAAGEGGIAVSGKVDGSVSTGSGNVIGDPHDESD
jgi:hypothetical protein